MKEKLKDVYRIAHPVAEVHASITESDSSERRCQPNKSSMSDMSKLPHKNDCTAFVCELHYRLGSLRCGASVQLLFSVPIVRKYQQQDCCLGMLVEELGSRVEESVQCMELRYSFPCCGTARRDLHLCGQRWGMILYCAYPKLGSMGGLIRQGHSVYHNA